MIRDIENHRSTYYMKEEGYRSKIHVVDPSFGDKYLRTYADEESDNNLDNLLRCFE